MSLIVIPRSVRHRVARPPSQTPPLRGWANSLVVISVRCKSCMSTFFRSPCLPRLASCSSASNCSFVSPFHPTYSPSDYGRGGTRVPPVSVQAGSYKAGVQYSCGHVPHVQLVGHYARCGRSARLPPFSRTPFYQVFDTCALARSDARFLHATVLHQDES